MKNRGSMTIEATFIIPILFFSMIAFLYIGMYLHDCYVIETVIRTATQREMRYVLQEESVKEGTIDWKYWGEKNMIWSFTANFEKEKNDLEQYIQESLEGKLLLAEQPNLTIEIAINQIIVCYESRVFWSMNFLKEWIGGAWDIVGDVKVDGIEPQEWIRMCRGLLNVTKK